MVVVVFAVVVALSLLVVATILLFVWGAEFEEVGLDVAGGLIVASIEISIEPFFVVDVDIVGGWLRVDGGV